MKYLCVVFFISFANAKTIDWIDVPKLVKKNNTQVELARIDIHIAKGEGLAAKTETDISFALAAYKENAESFGNSSLDLEVINEKTFGLSLGADTTLPFGTELGVSFQLLNIESTSLNAVAPKRYQLASQLTFEQPLLKGRSRYKNLNQTFISKEKIKRFNHELQAKYSEQVGKAYKHFWDLYEVQEKIKAKDLTLGHLKKTWEYVKKSRKGKVDRLSARAKLMRQKALKLKLLNDQKNLEDKLCKILMGRKLDNCKDLNLIATSSTPGSIKFSNIKSKKSLNRNSKLGGLWQEYLEEKIEFHEAEDQALPELNISGSYLLNGLDSKASETISDVASNKFPSFSIGISFTWNFGSHAEKGSKRKALYKMLEKRGEYLKERRELELQNKSLKNKYKENLKVFKLANERLKDQVDKADYYAKAMKLGALSIIDYLDKLTEMEKVRLDWVSARKNAFSTFHKIQKNYDFWGINN